MLIYMYWFNLLTISLLCVYVKLLFALILLCVSQCTMRGIYIAYGNCKQDPSYYECCPRKCNPGITHNPNKVFKTVNNRHILHLVTQQHHSKINLIQIKVRRLKPITLPLSEKLLRVNYHLCKLHTLDTAFELHQSSENTNRYFHIIDMMYFLENIY